MPDFCFSNSINKKVEFLLAIFFSSQQIAFCDISFNGTSRKGNLIPSVDANQIVTDLGGSIWFTNPRAVYYSGTNQRTYFGGVDGQTGDVYIFQYDHSTKGTTRFKLHAALQQDDHVVPSIYIRPNDQKIIAFYSTHGADQLFRYRISTNAEDISSWGSEVTIAVGENNTYTNPTYLSAEGKLYLFYRGYSTEAKGWSFITSTDNGDSWSSPTVLFFDLDGKQYLSLVGNGVDTIWFTASTHPNDASNQNSQYEFYYANGNFYKSDGTLIEAVADLPLVKSQMTLMYDASAVGNNNSWVHDMALIGGKPVVAFASYPSVNNHRYHYARWNGSSWIINTLVDDAGGYLFVSEEYYSGGMSIDKSNPNIVYLSKVVSGQWEMFKYETSDLGATWTITTITSDSLVKQFRPDVPLNHPSNFTVYWLFGAYTSFVNYTLGYLYTNI